MANKTTNPLGFLFGSGQNESKELTTDVIKIRHGTLLLSDKIINIRNIASVEVIPLAISFPWIAPLLLLGGFSLLQSKGISIVLGLGLFFFGGYLIYVYFQRLQARGLLILLNSGVNSSTLLTGISIDFLRQIAHTLYNIISTNDQSNVDIRVDQRTITEVSIAQVTNSVVATGSVSGSLVNSIN